MPPHKPIPTFAESSMSPSEYVMQIRTAWRNTLYTEASKVDMIKDITSTKFYTTQQSSRESVAAFSVELHKIFEQVRSAQPINVQF